MFGHQPTPAGDIATPVENSFFTTGKDLYLYKDGAKHHISIFVATQKHITPDYTFDAGMAAQWPDGIAIAPRDKTIVKGTSDSTVYYVDKGQLRPMTFAAYKARKITVKQITVLPQAEVDSYAKGDVLAK